MSKYQPLSDRLTGHSNDEWRASFSDLEEVLGFPLPKGARTGRTWWANNGDKSHHRAWSSVGWQVEEIDPATGYVTFRRAEARGFTTPDVEAIAPEPPPTASDSIQPEAMRKASQKAARAGALGKAAPAAIVAGVALVAGVAAMVARKALRRTSMPTS